MIKESGICLRKEACTNCGSSDAKQVYLQQDDTETSWCFACCTFVGSDEQAVEQEEGYSEKDYMTVNPEKLPTLAIPDRGLSKETAEVFGVTVAVSPVDGKTITHHYYPDRLKGKVVGHEVRSCEDKKFTSIGDRKGALDFWNQCNTTSGRKLFITEGRIDAMSLYQVIADFTPPKYKSYLPNVVSLTRGSSGVVKDIMNNIDFLGKYEEVILCFDQDAAGHKAVKEAQKVYPLAKVATFSENDPSDMLMLNKGKELYQACVWDSRVQRMGEVVDIHDILENAMLKPEMGISFPWPTVTKACFGIRPHTIHIVGAAPKIGKTDHQHQLVHHLVFNEGVKVGMFDLENSPVKTAKKLASKEAKTDFTRPDNNYDDELLRNSLMSLEGKVRFYDRCASRDWSDIAVAIKEMHLLDGINIFIVDPLTALVSRYASSEANDRLNEIATDMADLVQNYPITIFNYSHVNPKTKGTKPHETGAKVYSSEFTGSRAMEKWFHYGHGISRDRTDECPPEDKNMSQFYMLFDRDFGQGYNCDVYFDEATVTYLEPKRRL